MTDTNETITARLFDDRDRTTLDPFEIFEIWLTRAGETEPNDPNAMALATVDSSGLPDCRTVLLKGHDARGFVFYTNHGSAKGRELAGNPKAALLFHWKSVHRQVRVRGNVEHASDAESDAYFASRSRGSRIGAHASEQSRPLESREALVARVRELEARYEGSAVPRPDYWSGFRVVPGEIEFWQDGEFRLHDRVLFKRDASGAGWTRSRLYP